MSESKSPHPQWALLQKKPGTELKLIGGKYYLYGVKSVYSKELKRSKKVSLGILGSITEKEGFIASDKSELKRAAASKLTVQHIYAYEYGFSFWFYETIQEDGTLQKIKSLFPELWQFLILMVYCRILHQSPLKNIPFHLSNGSILQMIGIENYSDKHISEALRSLGHQRVSMQKYMQADIVKDTCVLMDATNIVSQSKNMDLAQQGYNSNMDFQTQLTLLYIYESKSLKPIFYRILPGNIRDVSAMTNTLHESGIKQCVFIADKGFYSEKNKEELEKNNVPYIIPLRRDNKKIDYSILENMEVSDKYFKFQKRFIFYAENKDKQISLYLDGQLKENEKNDYLGRIETIPEEYTREKYLQKVKSMGTIALTHNTQLNPKELYEEYKERGEIEQLFDHLKNTLDANVSYMQNENALHGWMFINHIALQTIYKLYAKLKNEPLNKKQSLNKKYSIQDAIMHLSKIQKVIINQDSYYITEQNALTKTLLSKLKISIT